MGLAFWLSGKTVWKFTELRMDCQRQKNVVPTGDVSVKGLFTGVPKEEASNQ